MLEQCKDCKTPKQMAALVGYEENPMIRGITAIAFPHALEVKLDYSPALTTMTMEVGILAENRAQLRERRLALAARLRVLADMIEMAA